MYENEIKVLESLQNYLRHVDARETEKRALGSAVKLMRAAEPKDEAAERTHCEQVARIAWDGPITLRECIEKQRAAARAEGYVAAKAEFEVFDKPSIEELSRALDENRALLVAATANGILDDFVSTADDKLLLAEEAGIAQLALKMAELLNASGVTQQNLAELLSITEPRVSQMFSGESNLTIKTVSRVACALGCRLEVNFVPNEKNAGIVIASMRAAGRAVDVAHTLETKLTAANARIAELEHAVERSRFLHSRAAADAVEFEIKLTALREAAERVEKIVSEGCMNAQTMPVFRAAIEASKK